MKEKQVWVVIQKQHDITWCAGIYDSLNEAIGDRFNEMSERCDNCKGETRITPLVELDDRDNGYEFSLESSIEEECVTISIFQGYYQIKESEVKE